MRIRKYFTVKEWQKFKVRKNNKNNYIDMQQVLCQKYDVILLDHKTKKEKIVSLLKIINLMNFDKGIAQFNKLFQTFGDSTEQLTREINHSKQDKQNLDSIWGKSDTSSLWEKSHNSVPIWGKSENNFDSQTRHEANLEKIWGKKN